MEKDLLPASVVPSATSRPDSDTHQEFGEDMEWLAQRKFKKMKEYEIEDAEANKVKLKAQQDLIAKYKEVGIELSAHDFPPMLFLSQDSYKAFCEATEEPYDSVLGGAFYSITGFSFVILGGDKYQNAVSIYHEMMHSIAKRSVSQNFSKQKSGEFNYSMSAGLYVSHKGRSQGDALEEGIVVHFSHQFAKAHYAEIPDQPLSYGQDMYLDLQLRKNDPYRYGVVSLFVEKMIEQCGPEMQRLLLRVRLLPSEKRQLMDLINSKYRSPFFDTLMEGRSDHKRHSLGSEVFKAKFNREEWDDLLFEIDTRYEHRMWLEEFVRNTFSRWQESARKRGEVLEKGSSAEFDHFKVVIRRKFESIFKGSPERAEKATALWIGFLQGESPDPSLLEPSVMAYQDFHLAKNVV